MSRRTSTFMVAAVAAAALVAWAAAESSAQKDPTPGVMRLKLDRAQGLLEGIAVSDFDRIGRDAGALIALTQQAEWKAVDDPKYLDYSLRMRRALEAMVDQTRAKNLDAVAYNYVQVTMTCVDCHKFIRDAAKVDAGAEGGAFELAEAGR